MGESPWKFESSRPHQTVLKYFKNKDFLESRLGRFATIESIEKMPQMWPEAHSHQTPFTDDPTVSLNDKSWANFVTKFESSRGHQSVGQGNRFSPPGGLRLWNGAVPRGLTAHRNPGEARDALHDCG